MIIEVLSPSNEKHDTITKYNLYQYYGIKEYWIVDTEEKEITVNILNQEGKYMSQRFNMEKEDIKVSIFDDLDISLKEFLKEDNEWVYKIP